MKDASIRYISVKEAAVILNLSSRRIVGLCHNGKLDGAVKERSGWMIPELSVQEYHGKSANSISPQRAKRNTYPLPCAVGRTSYIDIVTECYYVDKTLLIKDLIDSHNMVTLFARPRRFGKTMAMDMLKVFFEKSDTDNSIYFRDKKIWHCGKKYRSYLGAYPVISLSFKDVKYADWQQTMESISLVLKDEYKRHKELISSPALDEDDKDYIARLLAGRLSEVEYSRSLLTLCRMLSIHYAAKVVILIDEYDTPIQTGFSHGFYQEVISFMRTFLSGGLKDNSYLAFGVLTGILRVSKEDLFSGLNNPTVNTVLDQKFSSYFGFTAEEVNEMAKYYNGTNHLPEIVKWYDGYHFGKTDIYNPWSVVNYFSNGMQARAYWANTSSNEIIKEILQSLNPAVISRLINVLQGDPIQATLNLEVVYPQITDNADTIFSFLLLAGYLSPTSPYEETEFGTLITLRLPNMEVRRVYNAEILSWIRSSVSDGCVSEIEKAIYANDSKRLESAIRQYLISTVSAFDGAAEGFYHGMMLGLVACLSSKYFIRSNRESGNGRFDLQLEPKQKGIPPIIMEFKAAPAENKNSLSKLADQAVEQIKSKKYEQELFERGFDSITMYGIAFSGKNVEVSSVNQCLSSADLSQKE